LALASLTNGHGIFGFRAVVDQAPLEKIILSDKHCFLLLDDSISTIIIIGCALVLPSDCD
jgi:hypothetical protein